MHNIHKPIHKLSSEFHTIHHIKTKNNNFYEIYIHKSIKHKKLKTKFM